MRIRHISLVVVLLILFFSVVTAFAGDPDPSSPPGSISSYTLEDTYNPVDAGVGDPAPVERTGQTTCYNESYEETPCPATDLPGQDGELQKGVAWPNPRFTDNGNGTVTDNLTGLVWLKDASCSDTVGGVTGGKNSWADALTFSNNLAAGKCGLTDDSSAGDWRLPNVKELHSLIHFGFYDPALPNTLGTGQGTNGDPFTGVQPDRYWSSNTTPNTPYWALYVNMLNGVADGDSSPKEQVYYVWPVRSSSGTYPAPVERTGQAVPYGTGDDGDLEQGIAWPNPRFTDNGDGTVTDNLTGLVWLKDASCSDTVGGVTGEKKSWADALTFSNNLAAGKCGLTDDSSAGDWRLPNVKELHSLIHLGFYDPALPNTSGTGQGTDGAPFTGIQSKDGNYYWSSTTTTYAGDKAWPVDMHYGRVGHYIGGEVGYKTNAYYVWPVRDESRGNWVLYLPVIFRALPPDPAAQR